MQIDRRGLLQQAAASLVLGSGAAAAWGKTAAEAQNEPTANRPAARGTIASGNRAAVATVHELATDAGLEMFKQGGNAADAAVAAALMLAVVDGHNSGLGGGCFILARRAGGEIIAIDAREMAPAAAHAKMFFRNGKPDPKLSQTGALAAGVPGHVAGLHALSQRMGTGKWRAAARLAGQRAAEGFLLSPYGARRLASVADELADFPASRAVLFKDDERPWQAGERIVQSDLAKTLFALAEDGPDAFYRGQMAAATEDWMRSHGGLMTKADFANYTTVDRQPVRSQFRGHDVVGFPPPSSGGVHVAQILSLLERFPLAELAANQPAQYYHLVAEAMRLAFADRAVHLGDPDFTNVPLGLLDPEYLASRGEAIRVDKRMADVRAGLPPRAETWHFPSGNRHTTHLTAADQAGNWVAITATINTSYGSKVIIPGTGVVLNNEMDDFAIAPGVPNAFGLVGTAANAPAAGKRPLSSMSPTIVLREGQPVVTCGAAGGPRIISATVQILLRHLACQMSVDEAVLAPRVHHQWRPDVLRVETTIDEQVVEQLRSLGHVVEPIDAVATAQAIGLGTHDQLLAAAEPRLPGAAGALSMS